MKQFFCQVCNFSSNRKKDLERHFLTRKHLEMNNKYKNYGNNLSDYQNLNFGKKNQKGSHLLPFAPDCSFLLPNAPSQALQKRHLDLYYHPIWGLLSPY